MCYEREISFNNLLMCQIFTFESSRVVNSGWPVCVPCDCGGTKDSDGGGYDRGLECGGAGRRLARTF